MNDTSENDYWLHQGKDPIDPLHQLGIDYLIESTIVNFGVTSC